MKNIDLTTPAQKLMAGGLLIGTLFLLYYITPPLVILFQNLWMLALYVVPLLILVLNYKLVWAIYKNLVWKMTKKLISTDKLAYMYNYHTYLLEKIEKLEINTRNVNSARVKVERKLAETLSKLDDNKQRASYYSDSDKDTPSAKELFNRINIDQKQAEMLAPRLQAITQQEEYLTELLKHWTSDANNLKYTLDAKAEEYELLKELSEASGNASSFLNGNSQEYKMFAESLKQIENDVSMYTANVEMFEKKVAPILEGKISDRELSEEQGKRLVEEFMNNTKEISFKNL